MGNIAVTYTRKIWTRSVNLLIAEWTPQVSSRAGYPK